MPGLQLYFTSSPVSLQSSADNWYQGVHAVLVLGMTANKSIAQYPILENIGQYPIPQCQYRSNPSVDVADLPSVISGERLFFIDPHERYFLYQGDRTSGYLWHLKERQSELQQIPDQFAPFSSGICGSTKDVLRTGHYPGTLFRFPLRCAPSELSQVTYSHEHLEALLSQFESDARLLLIFLKSVERLEVLVRDEHSNPADVRFRVQLTDDCRDTVRKSRRCIVDAIRNCSSESFSTTYLLIVETEKYDVGKSVEKKTYRYWVNEFFAGGKASKVLTELREDPSVSRIPLVGTAIDLDAGSSMHSKLSSPISTKEDDTSGAEDPKRAPSGKIFCFLPLAVQEESATGLPVHVNGYFAISQNRQHLKWPCVGQTVESDKCLLWNHHLIAELIPRSYVDLLVTATRHSNLFTADDVYAAIPNVIEVDEKWQVGTCTVV